MQPFGIAFLAVYAAGVVYSVLRVLRRRREPQAMVAWILAIVLVPVFGVLAYWLIASDRLRRRAGRRRRRVAHLLDRLRAAAAQRAEASSVPGCAALPEDLAGIARLALRLGGMPLTAGNEVRFLAEANTTYRALEDAIRQARHHVHLQYYIWQPDETGRHFRDLLVEKARAGVECRVLLDAVGCYRLGARFLHPLAEAGAEVSFFMPLHGLRFGKRWTLHLRNHRKIVVVDGETAFLGSQNIGDEYRGRLRHLSPWYDGHLRIRGPAALFLQQTFAEDWSVAARQRLDDDVYFPLPRPAGDSLVQVLPSGPDQSVSALAHVLFAAVSAARHSIRIATPYFVPDAALRNALEYACARGVQVALVLPTCSDVPLALWAARSFYPELVDEGVQIYEYTGGVLHSKVITVDDRWSLLGSANMDARSFRLNFEITALLYDADLTQELARYIDGFCAGARLISPREAWQRGFFRQVGEGAARLLAPLL